MTPIGRRQALLAALGACVAAPALPAPAPTPHDDPGIVRPPRPIPDMTLQLDDGSPVQLRRWLEGRVTALQFVLTGCSAVCPLLGAIFADVQRRISAETGRDIQLLSVSLDPLGDTTDSLRRWRDRFGNAPTWRAALPRLDQTTLLDTLTRLGVQGGIRADNHSSAVLLVDRRACVAYRTEPLPDGRFIAEALRQMAA